MLTRGWLPRAGTKQIARMGRPKAFFGIKARPPFIT